MGESAVVVLSESDIFSFNHVVAADSGDEPPLPVPVEGSSQCLPYSELYLGPSVPPHKCPEKQGIRFWQLYWDFGGHSSQQ